MDSSRVDQVKFIAGNGSEPGDTAFFSILLDKTTCPVLYVTRDYRYKYANKAYADWIGIPAVEIAGRPVKELPGHEVFASIKDHMGPSLKGNGIQNETEVLYRHGRAFIEASYTPDFDEDGEVRGYVVILNDVTQKKQTEKELRNKQQELKNSREHYEKLLSMLPAAVYTTDKNGYITFYNEAAARLWGRYPVIGKDKWSGFSKIYKPDGITHVPFEAIPMAVLLKEGRKINGEELVVERADGSRGTVLPSPELLYDSEGNITGAINMLLDVTEKKKLTNIVHSWPQLSSPPTMLLLVKHWKELLPAGTSRPKDYLGIKKKK
jgi:PAS domain S-box-containing protein